MLPADNLVLPMMIDTSCQVGLQYGPWMACSDDNGRISANNNANTRLLIKYHRAK